MGRFRSALTCVVVLFAIACGPVESPSNYTPHPILSPTSRPLLVVLGDSIASGSTEGGIGQHGWPAIVATELHLRLANQAQGGTGYTVASLPGTAPYPLRGDAIIALHPDILIIEGSRNDSDAGATQKAASALLGEFRARLPFTRILVIGPIYSYPTNVGSTPVNDAVKVAAAEQELQFVDAVKAGWFTGSDHTLIGSDGVHPTDEGHRYLADKIEPLIRPLVAG